MKNNVCGIYRITSPSGKIYIGQSVNIIHRMKRYSSLDCKKQTRIYRSILKYGWEKHKFEIIHECKREELNDLESYYIKLYNCFNNEFGLNLSSGGNKNNFSIETRKRMSDAQHKLYASGYVCPSKGRLVSVETRKKIRIFNLGKTHSELTKTKISEGNKGKKVSQETRRKIGLRHKNKIVSIDTRKKQREVHLGKKLSQQAKDKSSAHYSRIRQEKLTMVF